MNLPLFIARRIRQTRQASFSATVARIGVASVGLGLAVMLVSFAVLGGFKTVIRDKITGFSGHVQVNKFTLNNSYEEEPISTRAPLYQQFRPDDRLRAIQAYAHKAGMLKTDQEVMGAVLKGVGRDYHWASFSQYLVAGRAIRYPSDTATYSGEVVVSQRIADQLRLAVGDSLTMYFVQKPPRARKLTVVGIYQTRLDELDNTLLLGDLGLVQRLNGWTTDQVGGFEVFVTHFDRLDEAFAEVVERMNQDMGAIKITDKYLSLFDWLSLLNRNVIIVLTLISFVACFNMVSILLIMMMERTAMIGLLQALGATQWQIRRVFLYNGLQLVARGLLLGNVVGLGLCAAQHYFRLIPLDPVNYFMAYVPVQWNFPAFILLNLATLTLVALVMLLPTLIVTRIRPVQALAFAK